MKLAEALQERADLNTNIEQLKQRLCNSALVQEGDAPLEDFVKLKSELDSSLNRLSYLITKINLTNCQTIVDNMTLTELIAKKDVLSLQIANYRAIVYAASQIAYRARGSEIRLKPTLSVPDMQDEINKLSKDLRLIDNKLQECNWTTDLIE